VKRQAQVRLPPGFLRLGLGQLRRFALNPDLPWEIQRRRLDKFMSAGPPVRGISLNRRELNEVPALVVSAGEPAGCVVVHFHGGGYCVGSAAMGKTWAGRLAAKAGCSVVLPEYRLAPEHPYPAGLEDARQVYKAVLADHAPGSVVLSGDSAGAGLALALAAALRDDGEPVPAGCVLISPWLDLGADRRADPVLVRKDHLLSPSWLSACARAYAEPARWADPWVSPLLGSFDGLPPLLIQAGSDDLLVPDADRLAALVPGSTYTKWPGMWHDFALQPGLVAAADSALAQVAWFTAKVTGS
jgi:monoterpene epsilon-lactone hydrolase